MANKVWRIRGGVYVDGLEPIVLDNTNARLIDQDETRLMKFTLSPGESQTISLTSFYRVRSLSMVSSNPVIVTINGGTPKPGVRVLIEMSGDGGDLLASMIVENSSSAIVDADITLAIGGDGVTP